MSGDPIAETWTAMGEIDRLVRAWYDAPDTLVSELRRYAETEHHDIGWYSQGGARRDARDRVGAAPLPLNVAFDLYPYYIV